MMKKESNLFFVKNKSFQNVNYRELNLFYLPIIGAKALSIYNFLWSLKENQIYDLSFVGKMFFCLPGAVYNEIEKLSALELLEINLSETNGYCFVLKTPKNQNILKNDPIFMDTLSNNVDKITLNKIKEEFSEDDSLPGFKRIEVSNNSIFSENVTDEFSFLENQLFGRVILSFLKEIPKKKQSKELLKRENIDELLVIISSNNLTTKDLIDVYYESTPNGEFSYKVFKDSLMNSLIKETNNNVFDIAEETIIKVAEESSLRYCVSAFDERHQKRILFMCQQFLIDNKDFDEKLLNFLLLIISNYEESKDGKTIEQRFNRNYLNKVAENWKKEGIMNVRTAYEFTQHKILDNDDVKPSTSSTGNKKDSKSKTKKVNKYGSNFQAIFDYFDDLDKEAFTDD